MTFNYSFQQILPQAISFFACILLAFSIPARQKKLACLGECVFPLRRKKSSKITAMFFLCLLVIFVTLIRKINALGNYVICAAAVLAFELTVRNFLLFRNSGVYQKGIYLQHPFVLYENIKSIPALLWEDADLSNKLDYQFVLKDSDNVTIVFQDKEEAELVMNQIKKNCPDIK